MCVNYTTTHYTNTGGSPLVSRPGRRCCNSSTVISINSAERKNSTYIGPRQITSNFLQVCHSTVDDTRYGILAGEWGEIALRL